MERKNVESMLFYMIEKLKLYSFFNGKNYRGLPRRLLTDITPMVSWGW